MFRLESLRAELLVFAALIGVTVAAAINPWSRTLIVRVAQIATRVLRSISAIIARVLDFLVPIDPRHGRVPPIRFVLWAVFNLLAVAAWIYAGWRISSPQALNSAGAVNLVFLVVNIFFLAGAYWALHEGVAIMNGDQAYRRSQFASLSTAKNVTMVCTALLLVILQIAVLLEWLQVAGGVQIVTIRRSFGVPYLNFLVATTNALPFLSFYVGTAGLSNSIAFTGVIGPWCFKAINAFGSVLLVSTIIGFIQQHIAFRKMIADLLTKTDNTTLPLIEKRFLRAPAAIKSYVREAFQSETNDDRRLKLVKLAVSRHSYSFPAVFIGSYPKLTDRSKREGTSILADFIDSKGHQFDTGALFEIAAAAKVTPLRGEPTQRQDCQRIGAILLPCLERLSDTKRYTARIVRKSRQMVCQKPLQLMLCALLSSGTTSERQRRSADLLIGARAQEAIPEMLRCLQYMGNELQVHVLSGATQIVSDPEIKFARTRGNDPLDEMVRTVDWNTHNVNFNAASLSALNAFRAAVIRKETDGPRRPKLRNLAAAPSPTAIT